MNPLDGVHQQLVSPHEPALASKTSNLLHIDTDALDTILGISDNAPELRLVCMYAARSVPLQGRLRPDAAALSPQSPSTEELESTTDMPCSISPKPDLAHTLSHSLRHKFVRHLDLSLLPAALNTTHLHIILSKFSHLQTLIIPGCTWLDDIYLSAHQSPFSPTLTHLDVTNTQITPRSLTHLTRLKSLSLSNTRCLPRLFQPNSTPRSTAALLSHLTTLTHLHLSGPSTATDIPVLLSTLPLLPSLASLHYAPPSTQPILWPAATTPHLARLTTLTSLHLTLGRLPRTSSTFNTTHSGRTTLLAAVAALTPLHSLSLHSLLEHDLEPPIDPFRATLADLTTLTILRHLSLHLAPHKPTTGFLAYPWLATTLPELGRSFSSLSSLDISLPYSSLPTKTPLTQAFSWLPSATTLQNLSLSCCDPAMVNCVPQPSHLTRLSLEITDHDPSGTRPACNAQEAHVACKALADLRELSLNGICLPVGIESMEALTSLTVVDCQLWSEDVERLMEAGQKLRKLEWVEGKADWRRESLRAVRKMSGLQEVVLGFRGLCDDGVLWSLLPLPDGVRSCTLKGECDWEGAVVRQLRRQCRVVCLEG